MRSLVPLVIASMSGVSTSGTGENRPQRLADLVRSTDAGVSVSWQSPTLGSRLLARAGDGLWIVDQTAGVLLVVKSDGRAEDAIPLPLEIARAPGPTLLVAPQNARQGWLVAPESRRAWKLVQGSWYPPVALPGKCFAAAALPDGGLVVNIPSPNREPFVIVAPDGTVLRRTGPHIDAPAPIVDAEYSTWELASTSDGFVAAHHYLPRITRFTLAGHLLWDRRQSCPAADRLERRRKELLGHEKPLPESSPGDIQILEFNRVVAVDPGGAIFVNLSGRPALDVFDATGSFLGDQRIEHADQVVLARFGLAVLPGHSWLSWGDAVAALVETTTSAVYVVDDDWLPVGGARAQFRAAGRGLSATVESDSSGAVLLPDWPPATVVSLRINMSGRLPLQKVATLGSFLGEVVVLERQPQVCVRVLSEDRVPIDDFKLSLSRRLRSAGTVRNEVGPTTASSPGSNVLCAAAPWPAPIALRVASKGFAAVDRVVSQARGEVEIIMEPQATVRLAVVDGDDKPVSGADAVVFPPEEASRTARSEVSSGSTDGEGVATFEGLRADEYVIEVRAEDALPWKQAVELQRGDNDLEVQLERGGGLDLTVHARDGTPISAAKVLVSCDRSSSPLREGETDGNGALQVSGLPLGPCRVAVLPRQHASAERQVTISEGTAELEIVLTAGARVRGRVVGVGPYSDLALVLESYVGTSFGQETRLTSDEFTLQDVPAGQLSLQIVASNAGGAPWVVAQRLVEIADGDDEVAVEIELPDPKRVNGVVLRGSESCSYCSLSARKVGPRSRISEGVTTDAQGRFEFRTLDFGSFLVTVKDPGSGQVAIRPVAIDGTPLEIQLLDNSLEVLVLDHSQRAVSDAEVRVLAGASTEIAFGLTDWAGEVVLEHLPASPLRVTASKGGLSGQREVDIPTEGPTTVTVSLEELPGVALELREPDGSLPSLVWAAVHGADGRSSVLQHLSPGADGLIELPGPITFPACVVLRTQSSAVTTVWLDTSPPRGFQVLLAAPCSVDVRSSFAGELLVLQESGRPLSLAFPVAPGPAPLPAGETIVSNLPPGQVRIQLRSGAGSQERWVRLSPGTTPVVTFGG